MIVISWNCQGIGNRETVRVAKNMISFHQPDVFVLLEPRISGVRAHKVCKELKFDDWARVESIGFSGGIWLFWKAYVLSINVICSSPQFIHCEVENGGHERWFLTITYGSPNVATTNLLWDALRNIGSDIQCPWISIGDFNAVLFSHERSSGLLGIDNKDMAFGDFFSDLGLVDMHFSGPQFTWSRGNSSDNFVGARIDRALYNIQWSLAFPNAFVQHLSRSLSDHCPIKLNLKNNNDEAQTRKRFFFQDAWFAHPNFMEWFKSS